MAGNVWEWTSSDYENDPSKVVRGGSFTVVAQFLRAAVRGRSHPDRRGHYFGFRCAQDP